MKNYQEPIIKIMFLPESDVCTLSLEEEDPWNDSDWNN